MKSLKDLLSGPPLLTIAAAESMTSGHVQARIGATPGASAYFLGGVTVYTLEQKAKLLQVDTAHAREVNSVSERVAREMALGVCLLFGADLGVATTGYAEPNKELSISAPMAWWSVCHRVPGKDPVIFAGKAELPDFKRVPAQQEIAAIAVIALTEYLAAKRGA